MNSEITFEQNRVIFNSRKMEFVDKNQKPLGLPQKEQSAGGFSFDLCERNERIKTTLGKDAGALPSAWKTGTTI